MNNPEVRPDKGGNGGRIVGIDILQIECGRPRAGRQDDSFIVSIGNRPVSFQFGVRTIAEKASVRLAWILDGIRVVRQSQAGLYRVDRIGVAGGRSPGEPQLMNVVSQDPVMAFQTVKRRPKGSCLRRSFSGRRLGDVMHGIGFD